MTQQNPIAPGASDSIRTPANDEKRPATTGTQQQLHKPPVMFFLLPLLLIIVYALFSR